MAAVDRMTKGLGQVKSDMKSIDKSCCEGSGIAASGSTSGFSGKAKTANVSKKKSPKMG